MPDTREIPANIIPNTWNILLLILTKSKVLRWERGHSHIQGGPDRLPCRALGGPPICVLTNISLFCTILDREYFANVFKMLSFFADILCFIHNSWMRALSVTALTVKM